jgi:hypothetical protein
MSAVCFFINSHNSAHAEKPSEMLFMDHTQPLEKRLDDLIGRLTLKEKIDYLAAKTDGIERLGIAGYSHWNHSAHGICGSLSYPNSKSVIYPTPNHHLSPSFPRNPLSPSSDPVQRRLQSPPAKSKFLAVSS